jgi:hypothetical protein
VNMAKFSISMFMICSLALFGVGCLSLSRDAGKTSHSCVSVSLLFDELLALPSEDRIVDLFLSCSRQLPTEDALVMLRDQLRRPALVVADVNGIKLTNHDIALVCLRAFIGSELNVTGLQVKAILSRRVLDVPYRYHVYGLESGDEKRLDHDASLWIAGFMAGRELPDKGRP